MNSPVSQIKERLAIEEIISSYVKLERAGVNFKAKCPFHNEKTPSFFISPARNTYYCFGCGAKGDIFSFIQEFEGLDFKGALKLLADRAGVVLPQYDQKKESEKDKLYQVMEEAKNFFMNNLSKNIAVNSYLKERGLKESTIHDFEVGFALDSWDSLYKYLKEKRFSDTEIDRAGLAKEGQRGYYDRFRSRIMFPINDSSGRVIAFSGRIFGEKAEEKEMAKYINSPETDLYNKSFVLYGLDRAKSAIRKNGFSILVEGQFDLILSHQSGFKNTIAASGTALSDNLKSKDEVVSNLGLVRRLSKNIVLAYDPDIAGIKAASKAGSMGLRIGMDVKVATMPEGVDPADLILSKGVDAWRESIRQSKHIIYFILDSINTRADGDVRKLGKMISEELLIFVNLLPSAIEKNHFIKEISNISGIRESALEEDLSKIVDDPKKETEESYAKKEELEEVLRLDHIKKRILGILLWQESLSAPAIDLLKTKNKIQEILGEEFEEFLDKKNIQKDDIVFEAEVFYEGGADVTKDLKELLDNLHEEILKERLLIKMVELRQVEREKDTEKSRQILQECQIISQNIEDIKKGRLKK